MFESSQTVVMCGRPSGLLRNVVLVFYERCDQAHVQAGFVVRQIQDIAIQYWRER